MTKTDPSTISGRTVSVVKFNFVSCNLNACGTVKPYSPTTLANYSLVVGSKLMLKLLLIVVFPYKTNDNLTIFLYFKMKTGINQAVCLIYAKL
ncbi:hypothetical protein [Moraxella equi]|uniref:Uncharacterized protein n=2 Tax=Moraxella equi TaxID=60442 RepID=A0ABX3NKU3_9GAMM|nr:hypothetical protein [Moraxella equi]OPH40099.1 hypothetical protein B5J93_00785 [Moraxella equi]